MKNFFPYLALFLVSCSGSGGMNSEPDEMNQPSNNDSIIFNCGVTSQNLENCQITQNQNSREFYIFNAMDAESTIDAPVIFSFHGGGGTAIANMEYMLPEHALNKLRNSLSKVGFSFGAIPEMTEKSGTFDLPLTKFGGRFGKDLDTPTDEFLNDDGISHMVEGGLALKIQYEMLSNSSCRIFAEIA